MYTSGGWSRFRAQHLVILPSFLVLVACAGGQSDAEESLAADAGETISQPSVPVAQSSTPSQTPVAPTAPSSTSAPTVAPSVGPAQTLPTLVVAAQDFKQTLIGGTVGADAGGVFRPDGIGAFRVSCGYSHMGFDDPIVYPGQPGASHLHVFFGNSGVDAFSSSQSLMAAAGSTCAGGLANRSAYWVPAMVDQRTMRAIAPTHVGVYYKSTDGASNPERRATIQLPEGIRFVFGNKMTQTTRVSPWWDSPGTYYCRRADNGEHYHNPGDGTFNGGQTTWDNDEQSIPNCRVGDELVMQIFGPQCWDGVNLDSPDHRSHVTYRKDVTNFVCPTSHPVNIPQLTYLVTYRLASGDDSSRWRLSSDPPESSGIKAGYTMHGDYWAAWQPAIQEAWMTNCVRAGKDCHQDLLGDGRTLSFPR
jgi:hypothetical protein